MLFHSSFFGRDYDCNSVDSIVAVFRFVSFYKVEREPSARTATHSSDNLEGYLGTYSV